VSTVSQAIRVSLILLTFITHDRHGRYRRVTSQCNYSLPTVIVREKEAIYADCIRRRNQRVDFSIYFSPNANCHANAVSIPDWQHPLS